MMSNFMVRLGLAGLGGLGFGGLAGLGLAV